MNPEVPTVDPNTNLLNELLSKMNQVIEQNKELAENNKELVKANSQLQFERNNETTRYDNSGVYRGRPDSAKHVTLVTRPVAAAPEQYDHPIGMGKVVVKGEKS